MGPGKPGNSLWHSPGLESPGNLSNVSNPDCENKLNLHYPKSVLRIKYYNHYLTLNTVFFLNFNSSILNSNSTEAINSLVS